MFKIVSRDFVLQYAFQATLGEIKLQYSRHDISQTETMSTNDRLLLNKHDHGHTSAYFTNNVSQM